MLLKAIYYYFILKLTVTISDTNLSYTKIKCEYIWKLQYKMIFAYTLLKYKQLSSSIDYCRGQDFLL